ncbi:hypothetical protein ACFX5U_01030 [Sphingobacterium sp. SG20118]|uniref:hypothetical protein n=1 Tax=Sphingobacterium TaxID=28453 RepID=UPI0004F8801E|nr:MULTISPECIES: hypothetical protein [Sphingobacterium]AIM35680.1 hypothetical protein KO02_02565 [Sphingobacterium sp. ML3W]MDH5828194.1 hypothetical protein [Sphingobacterium faecium]
MIETSKNHTISKIVAKSLMRIFVLLLALASVPLLSNQEAESKLDAKNVAFPNEMAIVAPALLFVIFIVLLVIMLKNKYSRVDINWQFSLCTIFLLIYLILLYSRIYPLIG